jgi:hypothetical protein
MSLFSGNAVQSSIGTGTTAGALQLEVLGKLIERYLLRSHPPARLRASEAAELLGFHEDDIALLVRENLIEPLGDPTHNAVKYFALSDVEALGRGRDGLSSGTKAIYGRNKGKSSHVCAQDARCDNDLTYKILVSNN